MMRMLITLEETYKLITEDDVDVLVNELPRIDSAKDHPSIANKFTTKPQGILISDSYNNPFFPIRPRPRIDTAKMDLFEIYLRFRELYSQFGVTLLPWHYVIEFINNRYFVFNTRPVDMKFPVSNIDVNDKRRDSWDEATKTFMRDQIFDIREAIHVLIVGDSNVDVYIKKFYELLGRICIMPFIRYFRLPEGINQRVFFLNIGHKLNQKVITKFIRR